MLFIIQFPLADSRGFVEEANILEQPIWSGLRESRSFVHFFGLADKRTKGVGDGSDEHFIKVQRAIRFLGSLNFTCEQTVIPFTCAFRRLHFDGDVIGKFELGIASRPFEEINFSAQQTRELLQFMLERPVSVRKMVSDKKHAHKHYPLIEADESLAKLFRHATTTKEALFSDEARSWWVIAGEPILFLLAEQNEVMAPPSDAKPMSIPEKYGFQLYSCTTNRQQSDLQTWIMQLTPDSDLGAARRLRIDLMRLHAEQECFRLVTGNIREGLILPRRSTAKSQYLQDYLDDARSYISRKRDALATNYNVDDPRTQAAQNILNQADPSTRERLIREANTALAELDSRLQKIDIRGNLRRGVNDAAKDILSAHITINNNSYNGPTQVNQGDGAKGEQKVRQDHYELHGDNQGVFGSGGTMEDSHAVINKLSNADADTKQQLTDLFNQLHQAIDQAPEAQKAQAADIAQKANALVEVADNSESNKAAVEYHVSKLKAAAENIKDALPTVFEIAGKIITFAAVFAAAHGVVL